MIPRTDCKNIEYQGTENDVQHVDNNIHNNKYRNSNNTIHQFSIDNLEEEQEKNSDNILCIDETAKKLSSDANKNENIDTEKSENEGRIDVEKEKDIVDMEIIQGKNDLYDNNGYRFENKSNGLSNFDIIKIARHSEIFNFRGTYTLDELPEVAKYKESGIVDLNNSHESGSHWVFL